MDPDGTPNAAAELEPARRRRPAGPPAAAVSHDPGTPDEAPDDADDLRGFHFRRLIGSRKLQIWVGIPTIVVAIGLSFGNLLWLPIVPIASALIALLVCWIVAVSRSEDAFFAAYASDRGMNRVEKGDLPGVTPLLRMGDEREATEILAGQLADDVDGTLALYTYTVVTYSENDRNETDYHFTVALTDVPECAEPLPLLYAQRKSGLKAFEIVEDVFRSNQRVRLESAKLDGQYEIFTGMEQDANFLRQVLTPSFIVWLTDEAPEKFAFELNDGSLCCNVKGHKKSAAELDAMRIAAATVARRLREEALEGSVTAG